MPRSRNIKPGFFKNEYLAELAPETRLLFIGLWTLADREGRLEDRPRRIRAELFPYDAFDVDLMLSDLASAGFVQRYDVAQKGAYIQIVNFAKHQSPHVNEQAGTIPAPEDLGANRPDSLLLNTDSLPPASRFDDFWAEYPKKVEKKKARALWEKRGLDALADRIIADLSQRKKQDAAWIKDGGKYIPNPTTYINGDRWEDEIVATADGSAALPPLPRDPAGILNFCAEYGGPGIRDHEDFQFTFMPKVEAWYRRTTGGEVMWASSQ
jgi:hypothetical protein